VIFQMSTGHCHKCILYFFYHSKYF